MSRRSPWDGLECRPAAGPPATAPTPPLGLQHLLIRSAHSRSASIDSRMNLSCFAAFRTAESKKKVHDAQCRRCLLMKRSIRIAEHVARADSFSVCVFGIEIEQSRFEREVGRLHRDCNELRASRREKRLCMAGEILAWVIAHIARRRSENTRSSR